MGVRAFRSLIRALLGLAVSLSACNSRTSSPVTESTAPATRSIGASGHRIALVIGNDSYQHVAPLHNARADARAVKAALKSVGFDVTLEEDVERVRQRVQAEPVPGGFRVRDPWGITAEFVAAP